MSRRIRNPNPPRWAVSLLEKLGHDADKYSLIDDLEIEYHDVRKKHNRWFASLWHTWHVLKSVPELTYLTLIWRMTMLYNYLKIVYRNFLRHKLFSFINIVGLTIGFVACVSISLWIKEECSYDRFHTNAENIYRVERFINYKNESDRYPNTTGLYGPTLVIDYPEIENYVRYWGRELSIKDHHNVIRLKQIMVSDNSVFDVFDFSLESGDPNTALIEPNSIVLTRENALRFLGTETAIGKTIPIELDGTSIDFLVTGILDQVPKNSHIQFDMLISFTSIPERRLSSWDGNFLHTYVQVKAGTSIRHLEEKFPAFMMKYVSPSIKSWTPTELADRIKIRLFPITDIHLNPCNSYEIGQHGDKTSVYIFYSAAIFILAAACINYINLSTARANKRAKEVGMRKALGAHRKQLYWQFLIESMLIALTAFILTVFVLLLISGSKHMIYEISFLKNSFKYSYLFLLLGAALFIGFLSGTYPAFYLTKFEPVKNIKNRNQQRTGNITFRKSLGIVQFMISIILITGTITIYKQMQYVRKASLGFNEENIVVIPVINDRVRKGIEHFRTELQGSPAIQNTSVSANVPGDQVFPTVTFKRDNSDDTYNMAYLMTDYDFEETYGINVIEGRGFSKQYGTDNSGAIMLTEMGASKFGWLPKHAIGQTIYTMSEQSIGKVTGVTNNFHYKSLHQMIEPLLIWLRPGRMNTISIRISPDDIEQALDYIRQKWIKVYPDEQFEYYFLDSHLNMMYENEKNTQNVLIIFSSLSIVIACLGLLGLATFTAEERTKEIGIRKVIGASSASIITLLSREFAKWILIANIAAFPLSWIFINKWLQNFAYKVNIHWTTFILSGSATLVIAFSTVCFQIFKAAQANPVESIKNE